MLSLPALLPAVGYVPSKSAELMISLEARLTFVFASPNFRQKPAATASPQFSLAKRVVRLRWGVCCGYTAGHAPLATCTRRGPTTGRRTSASSTRSRA